MGHNIVDTHRRDAGELIESGSLLEEAGFFIGWEI